MKQYEVRALDDLADGNGFHWKKDELYQVTEEGQDFILQAEENEIHYVESVKDRVLENFEVMANE